MAASTQALPIEQRQLSAILAKNSIKESIGGIDAADVAEIKELTLGLIREEQELMSRIGCTIASALVDAQGLLAWPEVVAEADGMISSGRLPMVRAGFNLFSLLAEDRAEDLCSPHQEHRNHVIHIISAMPGYLSLKDHALSRYIGDSFIAIHSEDPQLVDEHQSRILEVRLHLQVTHANCIPLDTLWVY